MVKQIAGIFLIILLFFSETIAASTKDFGLGIILGSPTGLSFKKWTSNNTAIDGAVAWSLGKDGKLHLHADYLFHNFTITSPPEGSLPIYYGIGGRLLLSDESRLGIRIPVGIEYLFAKAPFDLFFEIAPTLDLIPATEFDLNAGIGARFYF